MRVGIGAASRFGASLLALVGWLAAVTVGMVLPGSASASVAPVTVNSLAPPVLEGSSNAAAGPSVTGQVFWAYVAAGGSLDVGGEFRNFETGGTMTELRVTAVSPSGVLHSQVVPVVATDPLPALSMLGLTDPVAGVWRVEFDAGVPGDDPDGGLLRWGITPRTDTGVALAGRVFVDGYGQSAYAMRPVGSKQWVARMASWDESLYFVNTDGVTYHGQFRGINPIQGSITASPRGVVDAAGVSMHASASVRDPSSAIGPERYRVFFEAPDPLMPDSAMFADGMSRWLGPNYHDPLVVDIVHTPTPAATDGAWAGSISWKVSGAAGASKVLIDTDRDGTFDRTLDAGGATQVLWDGKNSAGKVLSRRADVTVRVVIAEVAEIHFTLDDVEQLTGGIEVTALSGPQAGLKNLSWNDELLPNACETNAGAPVACGSIASPRTAAGVDSSGGVHGWAPGDPNGNPVSAGWGDARYIDHWTSTPVKVSATAALGGRRLGAKDDTASTVSGKPVTVDVLDNDPESRDSTSPDEPVEVTISDCSTSDGVWQVNADQSVTFTPAAAFHGTVACSYAVTGPEGESAGATVTVSVANIVRAVDDHAETTSGAWVEIGVLNNDVAVDDGSRLTVSGTDPAQGTWTVRGGSSGRATVVFVPAEGFHGIATATYVVTEPDGSQSTATITVMVANQVVAVADKATTRSGKSVGVKVLDNDSNVDGGAVVSVTNADRNQGTWEVTPGGRVVFTPKPGFVGTATATYTVTEPDGTQSTATITIKVKGPASGPGETSGQVDAVRDHAATQAGKPVEIDVISNDHHVGKGAEVTITKSQASQGTWTVRPDGTVVFTPAPGFHGTATATYTLTNADGEHASATITVTVNPDGAGTNAGSGPGTGAATGTGALPSVGGPALGLLVLGTLMLGLGMATVWMARLSRRSGGRQG